MTVRETWSGKRDHDGGSTDDVERVTSLGFRHGRHDQRQATTSERQQLVRQEEAAARHGHSRRRCVNDVRPINSLRRTVLDSTHVKAARQPVHRQLRSTHRSAAAHTRTAARQLARPATPTHTRTHSPTTSTHDYWATLVHPLSSASGAQFYLHCVSVTRPSHSLLTQHVLRRCSQLSILSLSLSQSLLNSI